MARLELLKGPQGLFYGKSTTAGIVSIYTADPTKDWDTELSLGYETKAEEKRVDAHISGPVTDKLGVRLAGYYENMAGFLYNPNPTVQRHRLSNEEGGARLTLKWGDPDSGFRAKFKAGFTNRYGHMSAAATQGFGCPLGVRQSSLIAAYDNCRLDRFTQGYADAPPYNPNINPFTAAPADFATATFDPRFKDGQPYNRGKTVNLMLQLDYDLMQGLTLTSVTGYGWVDTVDTVQSGFGPGTAFQAASSFATHNYSEEVRLTSSWKDSWINFMVGGLIAPSDSNDSEYGAIPDFGLWQTELVKMKTRY
jgi:iron complex outermembrane receptor protein